MNGKRLLMKLAMALGALHPRAIAGVAARVARAAANEGQKRLRFPQVRFGPRTLIIGTCRFEDQVVIGPDSTIVSSAFGRYSYCAFRGWIANAEIGRFCSIGPGTIIGMGRHPSRSYVSTHPAFFSPSFPEHARFAVQPFEEHAPVSIGSDVWIGANVFVGPGVSIGHGAIIGTGAVVTKDVAPYEVVGGIPARRLRMRFEAPDIAYLLDLTWWDWPDAELRRLGARFSELGDLRAALASCPEEKMRKS